MKPFPIDFIDNTQALAALLTDQADIDLIEHLAVKSYEVHLGLTPEWTNAINELADQISIREYCPRDRTERFASLEAAGQWLSKGRAVFLLFKRQNDKLRLAGYGWSGRGATPQVPFGETTFALRISETDQGNGLATPFAKLILDATTTLYGAPNLWLETWSSNGGAVHTYHKLGFATVNEKPGDRPTVAGQTVPDTRFFMTLPDQI